MMNNDIIQVDYEQLAEIANRFQCLATNIQQVNGKIVQCVDSLRNGGWEGQGVSSFLKEMDVDIFPATSRLINALDNGCSVTHQVSQILFAAEEVAAAPFKIAASTLPAQQKTAVPVTDNISLADYMKNFALHQGDSELCSTFAQLMILNAMGKDIDIQDVGLIDRVVDGFDIDHLINKYGIETENVSNNPQEWLLDSISQNKGIIITVDSDILWYGKDAPGILGDYGGRHEIVVVGHSDGYYRILDPAQGKITIISERTLINAWEDMGYKGRATKEPMPIDKSGGGGGAW